MEQFSDASKAIILFNECPRFSKRKNLWALHAWWGLALFICEPVTDTYPCSLHKSLVLSLSPVNVSALAEPRGLRPDQLLCGWLSDSQHARKHSAVLIWWRLSVHKSCRVPARSPWAKLTVDRTKLSIRKREMWIGADSRGWRSDWNMNGFESGLRHPSIFSSSWLMNHRCIAFPEFERLCNFYFPCVYSNKSTMSVFVSILFQPEKSLTSPKVCRNTHRLFNSPSVYI